MPIFLKTLGNAPTTSPIPPTFAMGAASAATNRIRMVFFVSLILPIQLSVSVISS